MRKRRQWRRRAPNHERWLVSYADFITLLFAFFVVMYSAAQTDRKKIAQLATAIRVAFQQYSALPTAAEQALTVDTAALSPPASVNPADDQDLRDLRKELEQSLAEEISRGEVALRSSPEGLVISLREIGFFDSGSAGIKAASQPAFARMASLLRGRNRPIRIEGYTDNVPIHNSQFNSNWELSTTRATEMIRVLIMRYGFPPETLSAAGYGEYHPVASNRTELGRAQNRRVDVVILRRMRVPAANDQDLTPSQSAGAISQ